MPKESSSSVTLSGKLSAFFTLLAKASLSKSSALPMIVKFASITGR